ncbi:MAG: amidohydrolase family protein [Phycisphaerales bacterium]|nr:amidohydrolase family protein [Phycisphaerales bacterium]
MTTRLRRCLYATGAAVLIAASIAAQPTSRSPLDAPPNGMARHPIEHSIIAGGSAHLAPGRVVENAWIEMREGRIVEAGPAGGRTKADAPSGATFVDATGRHIYPGFIDPFVEVDAPMPGASPEKHWNALVTPERAAIEGPGLEKNDREALRAQGFVAANITPKGGMFRGASAVVTLDDPAEASSSRRPAVYRGRAFQVVGFAQTSEPQGYPDSHMGSVALLRQTLSDAAWYAQGHGPAPAPFAALGAPGEASLPLLFDVATELTGLHAIDAAEEAGRPLVLVGSGTEYKRLEAYRRAGVPVVVPLRFPKAPELTSYAAAESVELEAMMSWEQAPSNPRRLLRAGLKVALTSSKVKDRGEYLANLRLAAAFGLSEDEALAMLTTTPADLLGVSEVLGTIAPGKAASLVMMDGPLLGEKSKVLDVWCDGARFEISKPARDDVAGVWELSRPDDATQPLATLTIDPREGKVTFKAKHADGEDHFEGSGLVIQGDTLNFVLRDQGEDSDLPVLVVSAVIEGQTIRGWSRVDEGRIVHFSGTRTGPLEAEAEKKDGASPHAARLAGLPETYGYPFGAYALVEPPAQESVLFTNVTLWTAGPAGIIKDGALLIGEGKVLYAGPGAGMPRVNTNTVRMVDGTGLHITPGIIDTHSHTGGFRLGVNEAGQACTAEVRIADAIDPGEMNFYRQLAGGVTTVQSLHGSANPMGGQAMTQKLRWGAIHPRDMHFEGAVPGIKFALGENVKQSHWGEEFRIRYPQTRLGVETFMRDRFMAARAYDRAKKAGENPRPDLELEALAEILRGERWIHCHSYRQDEIVMLCRLATELGIRIGTFQHALEVYKVAEEVRKVAVGASGFSDWWAYKPEVYDAIPQAFPLMSRAGVLASLNSDSDDLARRLNTEAAKMIRYGDLTPEEAIRFVTINPAIQLGIEGRVGSLEAGKDADLAIWSGDPLSGYSRCVSTWVDGREYFSIERDRAMRAEVARERQRLIQKILTLKDKKKGEKKEGEKPEGDEAAPADPPRPEPLLVRSMRDRVRARFEEAYSRGEALDSLVCGACGCSEFDEVFRLVELEGSR